MVSKESACARLGEASETWVDQGIKECAKLAIGSELGVVEDHLAFLQKVELSVTKRSACRSKISVHSSRNRHP